MASTACLREVEPVEIPLDVISPEQYIEQRLEEVDAEDREKWAQRQRAYALLALEPEPDDVGYEKTAEQWVSTVDALYWSDEDRVVIIDRGRRELDSVGAVSLLVHEYSHALQARLESMAEQPPTPDGRMARSAVVEGDATLTADRALLSMWGIDEHEVPWNAVFDGWQKRGRGHYGTVPHKIELAFRYFTYPFGLEWVQRRFREGGQDAVLAALADPPASARELMAGPDAPEPTGGWLESLAEEGKPELEARYELLEAEQRGRWVFEGFLDAVTSAAQELLQMDGTHLRGDMLTLWMDADSSAPLAVWRLRFERREDAAHLVSAVSEIEVSGAFIHAYLEGDDAIIIGSPDRETGRELVGALTWGPVPDSSMSADGMRPGAGSRVACWLPAARSRALRP